VTRDELAASRAKLEPRIKPFVLERIRKQPTPCAVLLGPTGVGKTSAMRWLALAVGPLAYEIRASRLGNAPRRHGLGEGDAPEIVRARSARVLCLDDLGTEEERDVGTLQEVIDHRYSEGLATITTTGLKQTELTEHLGAAYVRRLVEQHVVHKGKELPVLVLDLFHDRPSLRS
jgi:DNA replication protein DnaC